ncbi:SRPBCC family protein [Muricauda sp. CAU 1633]|uniref:SRPBCC family protein n=1 Tax=Allomuricauda sp. CAU 1633 TaxID=2816036 RepID=UPI001A8FB52E|nr:SRPBCC family protein [Muricauda sp. CAU 1633]MBO0323426.1 SRPBCC family protein [Muricauda sp. CAU 1633]
MKEKMETQNRSVHIARTLQAPIELVWEVWSKPEHIAQWWGPSGFTNTIHKMDFQDGGEWNFIMHGPDGKNYPNRSVFKEIVPFEKIVYEHFNPHFITTVLFEAKEEETIIDWTVVFDTAKMLQTVIKAHKADEGLKQNLEKLATYLSKQKPM